MAALIGVSVKPTAGSDYSCQVPLDLLSEDGVPPAQGDKVSYSVDGTVTAVTGTTATIKLDAINGEPVSGDSGKESTEGAVPEAESTADMGTRLRAGAKGNNLPLF
jgi:hypothetical protein